MLRHAAAIKIAERQLETKANTLYTQVATSTLSKHIVMPHNAVLGIARHPIEAKKPIQLNGVITVEKDLNFGLNYENYIRIIFILIIISL